jgi:hypothetical protein
MHNLSLELYTVANAIADRRAASLMRQAAEQMDALRAQLAEFLEVHGGDDAASAEIGDVLARLGAPAETLSQIEALCDAAGFAGLVDAETMRARIDELHATQAGCRQLILERTRQLAALNQYQNARRRYHLSADYSFHFADVLAEWCQREAEPLQFTTPERATHHLVVADDDDLIEIGLKRIPDNHPVAILCRGHLTDFPTVRAAREAISAAGAPCPA